MRSEWVEDPVIAGNLVQSAPRRFVLVTGAGRSGTSTVAGALSYLGLQLPQPVLATNKSNPRGFFESFWAIQFHRGIMERAGIDTFDARPEAVERIQQVLRPEDRREVEEWLASQARRAPQVVVKDPRSAWMPGLWAEASASVGLSMRYLTMLRHPAEVVGSRSTYYAKGDAEAVRNYQITNIARWVNANLITERQTRDEPRSYVRYYDLIDDWRRAMSAVRDDLDLTFNTDVRSGEPHPVDEFIDPALRRHHVTWQELSVPGPLQAIAEETWLACGVLADNHGSDEKAQAALDDLGERFATLFREATAMTRDVSAAAANAARKKAVRQTRVKMRRALANQADQAGQSDGDTPHASGQPSLRRLAARAATTARRRRDTLTSSPDPRPTDTWPTTEDVE